MGSVSRYNQYERNTSLDNEDILEKCIRRGYSKVSKAMLYEELVEKLIQEVIDEYDSEYKDTKIFEYVMAYGTKKEIGFIDQRLCDEENPMDVDRDTYQWYLDELPGLQAKIDKEEAEAEAIEQAKENYATAYNMAINGGLNE